jgi:hypothetical protein
VNEPTHVLPRATLHIDLASNLTIFLSHHPNYSYVMSQQAKEDTMGATLQIGQMLKGKLGSYKLTKQLHHTVWQAT